MNDSSNHAPWTSCFRGRSRSEYLALAALGLLVLISTWRIAGGNVVLGQDSATQFYPWYSYLGERLRNFDLPAWSSAQFSGSPFAADPQSGWGYIPAMVLFTLFPLSVAIPLFVMFHFIVSAFGTYALSRAIGLAPLGSLIAGAAYLLSGPIFSRSVCCPAQSEVVTWVPVALLGVEMGLRREEWIPRLTWFTISALAMSQIYAAWLGQGTYYAIVLLGSFMVYRGLIETAVPKRVWRERMGVTASAILWIGAGSAGLAAIGIVPRIYYNSLTNLAGGNYEGDLAYAADNGGWEAGQTVFRSFDQNSYYMGGIVIALATMALLLARFRKTSVFFSVVMVGGFALSSASETPLHRVLYAVLPGFETFHGHWPERLALVSFIAIAMLAGIAVDSLPSWQHAGKPVFAIAAIPVVISIGFVVGLNSAGDTLPTVLLVGVAIVALVTILIGLTRSKVEPQMLLVGLVVLAILDLLVANGRMLNDGPYGGYHEVDPVDYFAPSSAAQYLQLRADDESFRFFGFDPRLWFPSEAGPVYYRYQFGVELTRDLEVNNRATLHGLKDVQGYNPVQLQAYVDFIEAINGSPQDYHDSNILPSGVNSPLLDLLSARFIIIPSRDLSGGNADIEALRESLPMVFDDGTTTILERPTALPGAWLVHDAVTMDAEIAWKAVLDGSIDPATKATVDGEVPSLGEPSGPDQVSIDERSPEKIVIDIETTADGLLVLGEIAYPGWKASVDGVEVPMSTAFGLLRSLPVPAGRHQVEVWYSARTERIGAGLSILTMLLMVSTFAGLSWRSRRGKSGAVVLDSETNSGTA